MGNDYDDIKKEINKNVVILNKQVQRLMYHIQLDGLDHIGGVELCCINTYLSQAIQLPNDIFTILIDNRSN